MKRIFILLTVALLLQGCNALLYVSNTIPTPLLQEKGESQISAEYGTNGANLNLVTSPFENTAFSISGLSNKTTKKNDISGKEYKNVSKHTYLETALGYYNPGDKFVTEIFVGYGKGSGNDLNYEQYFFSKDIHVNSSSGKFDKYFLQTNFGIRGEAYAIGFAVRVSYLNFYYLAKEVDGIRINSSQKESFFLEPAVFARTGGKNLQFELQIMLSNARKEIDFDYFPFIISAGVRFIF